MVKRGRKPNAERKGYFYEEQEEAVVKYLNSTDEEEKNEIFNNVIKPAFTKMVESIIRRYNLYIPDEEFEQTFSDTLSFLLTKVHNFKPEKNKKAYSYYGTVCKNYLVLKLNKFKKMQKRVLPYEDVATEFGNNIKFSSEIYDDSNFISELIENTIKRVESMLSDKSNVVLNTNERKVGEALKLLLENWEQVLTTDGSTKLNKSAVLFYLRESTNLNTKEVRDAMKKFKIGYYDTKRDMLNE